MQQPLLLNYGTRRATPWWRYLLMTAVLIAAGFGVKKCGSAVWGKYQLLSSQSVCMNFKPAPGDKAREDQLGARFAIELKNTVPTQPSIKGANGDFIFIGSLWNKHGKRLVLIRRYGMEEMNFDTLWFFPDEFRAYVLEPGTVFRAPRMLTDEDVEPTYTPDKSGAADPAFPADMRWIGVRDPQDSIRFSVPYQGKNENYDYFSGEGIFEGWLDDSDHIHLVDTSAKSNWKRYCESVNRINASIGQ